MRSFITIILLFCSAVLPLRAEDKVDEALARASQYLLSVQDPATGGIHNKMRHETAMTSGSV